MRRAVLLLPLGIVLSGCGGGDELTAAKLRSCVHGRLPAGSVDSVRSSTEEGVTTITYVRNGSETIVSVFASTADAEAAERAEARLGDAHDRRVKNVLYSGGGAAETAIAACVGGP